VISARVAPSATQRLDLKDRGKLGDALQRWIARPLFQFAQIGAVAARFVTGFSCEMPLAGLLVAGSRLAFTHQGRCERVTSSTGTGL
jgi:hypothetical protein